jgi:protein TonB
VEDNQVYDFVSIETPPSFPGGINKFYAYVGKNVKYPPMAAENNIQGKVFLSFVVEKNGDLTDIQLAGKKLGGGTDEEAMRVLKASPRWSPGIQNGKPVRVKYNIPISFTLSQ